MQSIPGTGSTYSQVRPLGTAFHRKGTRLIPGHVQSARQALREASRGQHTRDTTLKNLQVYLSMPSQWALPTPTPLSAASHLSWLIIDPWVTHDVIIDIVTPALWRHTSPHHVCKGSCLTLRPTPCMEPALLVRRVEVGSPFSSSL